MKKGSGNPPYSTRKPAAHKGARTPPGKANAERSDRKATAARMGRIVHRYQGK